MASGEHVLSLLQDRRDFYRDRNDRMNRLVSVYHGQLDKLYPADFPSGEIAMTPNLVKLAWDQYMSMVSKVPDKSVRAIGLSDRSQARASKLEQIVTSYDEGDRMKVLMQMHAWYLVGFGSAAMGVLPDFQLNKPRFQVEDPRNVYPSPGFDAVYASAAEITSASGTPNDDNRDLRSARAGQGDPWYAGDMEDCLIERLATIRSLKRQFPAASFALGADTEDNLKRQVRVLLYYDRDSTTVVAIVERRPVVLVMARHNLGFVPWRVTQTFAPDQVGGISQFEEQVPMLLALSRIWQQKLAFNDNTAWPRVWVKGNVNSMRLGPFEMLQLDQGAEIGTLPMPAEFQADRDIQNLERIIRSLNREGGAIAGDVSGGPITGRGIEQLARPADTLVQHYWNLTAPDLSALYGYALAVDEHFWPDDRKLFAGRKDGNEFEGHYTPSKDIAGHRNVGITYGFGVGGIEGFIQALQAMQAGLMSEETVMEQMPGVRSVSQERRKVEINRLERSIFAAFEAGDVPRAQYLAAVKEEVADGTPLSEAIRKIPPPQPPGQPDLLQALGGGGVPGVPGQEVLGPEQQAAALQAGGVPDLGQLLAGV